MALILSIVVLFAPEIILIIAGNSYVEARWIVPPVAMSVLLLFYTQISANYEFYYESKLTLTMSTVLAALLNIIANAICIPRFGYWAAGYTTLLSYIILTLSNYIARKIILKRNCIEDVGVDTKRLMFILTLFYAFNILSMMLYSYFVFRLIIMIIVLIAVFLCRKIIIEKIIIIKSEFSVNGEQL